jgi:hypothetical protein
MGVIAGDDTAIGPTSTDMYLVDVLLLCVECHQPIKARINTSQWIRVEWIGPSGECQACNHQAKERKSNGLST